MIDLVAQIFFSALFAVTGAGGVIGTALMAYVILRERPRGLRGLGVGVAAAALVPLQVN